MGGRGCFAGSNNNEVRIEEQLLRIEVENLIEKNMKNALETLEAHGGGAQGGAGGGATALKRCACCRQHSIPAYSEYAVCPICGWIDDLLQNKEPDRTEGSNNCSLNEARRRWKEEHGHS